MRTLRLRARIVIFGLLVSTVAAASDLFLDYGSSASGISNVTSLGEPNRWGKPFSPSASGNVTALQVSMSGVLGQGAARFVLELRADDGGVPGELIAFGSADGGMASSDVTVTMVPADVFISRGTAYWAVLYGQQRDWVAWRFASNVADTNDQSQNDGGTWSAVTNKHLTLRVIGTLFNGPVPADDEFTGLEDVSSVYPSVLTNDSPSSGVQPLFWSGPSFASFYANGMFDLTALPNDYYGDQVFQYVLDAGNGAVSAPATVTVHILPVNDPPSFSNGPDVTVGEDSTVSLPWATNVKAGPPNESAQGLTFEVLSLTNPALFLVPPTIDPTGQLAFALASDHAGSSDLTLRLHDDGGTDNSGQDSSAITSFRINVWQQNDPPSFDGGPDVFAYNDAGIVTFFHWAQDLSPGPFDPPQGFSFDTTTDAGALFDVAPSVTPLGDLTFVPRLGAVGTADVSVVLWDDGAASDGGPLSSGPYTFHVSLDDGPPFDAGPPTIIYVDGGVVPPERPRGHYACAATASELGVAFLVVAFALSRRRRVSSD